MTHTGVDVFSSATSGCRKFCLQIRMSFAPRYCYLEKGERGYGFNLHGEAPESNEEPISPHRTFYHVIKAVDAKSPAQYGGLKQG